MKCSRCEQSLIGKPAWREVVGYEKPRNEGGTNHLLLRKNTGKLLCEPCIQILKPGSARGQASLLDG